MYNICQAQNKSNKNNCTKKAIKNTKYCGLHKNFKKVLENFNFCEFIKKYDTIKNKCNKKKILSKYYFLLDLFYKENLLNICESFNEIKIKDLIIIDNKTWDINLLFDLWGNMLCSTEMQNPSPVFPANPFTRKNISKKDFEEINKIIKLNKIKLYGPLKYLIENYLEIFKYDIDEYNTSKSLSRILISILEKKYRFRLLNIKNSQDSYIGIWVDKNDDLSDFEIFYNFYDTLPIQIQDLFGYITDNPEKIQYKNLLDNYPKENDITIYKFYK